VADPTAVLGTGREAGPDEDDFHTFKRRTIEVDRDEKQATKRKQTLELRASAHSRVVKAFGSVPSAMAKKKVVVFK
jgi:zinc finger CCHC domain-containing protein 9